MTSLICREPKLGEQTLYQGQGLEVRGPALFLLCPLQMILVYVRVDTNTDK
jgi:hypothetical protein